MAGRPRLGLASRLSLLFFAWFQAASAHGSDLSPTTAPSCGRWFRLSPAGWTAGRRLKLFVPSVEPPANVSLRCHNLEDLLLWSYGPQVAGLRFRVEILSLERPLKVVWVDPPALQANISLLTNPVDDNFVSVTAVVLEEDSQPSQGTTFSYSSTSLVKHKCFVDFPPVAVNVTPGGHVLFQFNHPWLSYGSRTPLTKSRQKKSDEEKTQTPEFSYTVKVNQHVEEKFECVASVCAGKLPVDPGQHRQCLGVEGEMQSMMVRGPQEYCATVLQDTPDKTNNDIYITASVLAIVAVIALAVVAFIVYKKKTVPSAFPPKSMVISGRRKPRILNLSQDLVSVPQVDSRSPNPLLTDQSEEEAATPAGASDEPDLRLPLGVEVEEGNDGENEYMRGSRVEAAAMNGSGYEQRPVVRVELGPGEAAEGYRLGGL